jgi:hypothetical protein
LTPADARLVQHACRKTPVLFVAARELPKGASVEWQVARHTGDSSWPVIPRIRGNKISGDESSDDDDGDDETARVQVAYTRGRQASVFLALTLILMVALRCNRCD